MAQGDGHVYNNFKEQLMLKTIDLINDVLKAALYSTSFSATDIDGAAPAYSTTNEIVASGYTAGGATLGTKTVTQDDTNDRAAFDCADITWTSLATATIGKVLIYDDTTATKWILIAFEITTNSNGGNYTLTINANGLLLLS